MAKKAFNKWSTVLQPSENIELIAANDIHYKTAAVQHYLKLAVKESIKKTSNVHQLRAWSRRAVVTLNFYKDYLQKSRASKLKRLLNSIRKSTNYARDLDVLIEQYKSEKSSAHNKKFIKFLKSEREKCQQPIYDTYMDLNKGKVLSKRLRFIDEKFHALAGADLEGSYLTFEQLAKSNIRKLSTKFFDSMDTFSTNSKELHKSRVHGKRLRYTMELTASIFDNEFKTLLYKDLSNILSMLGKVNDSFVFQRQLEFWINNTNNLDLVCIFQELYETNNSRLDLLLEQLNEHCPPQHIKLLRERFYGISTDSQIKEVA